MGSDFLRNLSERLTIIRGQMSQATFAPILGVHKNTVGIYERAESEIGAESVANLVKLGWNANWILTGDGPERLSDAVSGPSQSLRPDTLKMAVTLAQEALDGLTLDPGDYAELVSLIYDALHNGLESARVLAFAKPAARGLGAKNGREPVGGPGAQAPGKG